MDYNVYDALRAGFERVIFVVRGEILADVRTHVERVFGDALPAEFVLQDLGRLPEGFHAPPDRRKPWGTAQAVLIAAERIVGPFAVCNADDQYGPGAFSRLHEYLTLDPVPSEGVLVGYPLRETLSGAGGVARAICHWAGTRCSRALSRCGTSAERTRGSWVWKETRPRWTSAETSWCR
jgi:hypothetical protein